MSTPTSGPRFLGRFDRTWAALRRSQILRGLCGTALVALAGLALLAAADYRLELRRTPRAIGLAVAAAAALAAAWRLVLEPMRWWTRPRTAAEIERRFPQLGQRIRTVVQYAGLPDEAIDAEGARPSLVAALEQETQLRTDAVPLDAVVPRRRLWAAATLVAAAALAIGGAALLDPEWRIALRRALLSDASYTTLVIAPGNVRVDQGSDVRIVVELQGRTRRDVRLATRPADDPVTPWGAVRLDPPDHGPPSRRELTLKKVQGPIDYDVFSYSDPAGVFSDAVLSPTYRIDVRYPLAVKSFEVALVPPAYTGVKPSTAKGGDLRAIEGTGATFRITFDAPPAEAALVVSDPPNLSRGKVKPTPPRTIPLKVQGRQLVADMILAKDLRYQIAARTADGRVLPENHYRIDVRPDAPPRVAFEEPDEALEVHPVAEVLHRIRAGDDFGLTRAGIAFRANDGEEQTLILEQFPPRAGKPRPSATLEATLLLEELALTPTDSVTYYAFAEDNFPGTPRRAETDLRFIDIRPFKRIYKVAEPGEMMGPPRDSIALEELIARQRFNLNRTARLAKYRPTDRAEPQDVLKIANFEETLAGLTKEFGDGLEGIAGERIEPIRRAEEAMLAAVDALDNGRNAAAATREAEAVRLLIEVRRKVLFLLSDSQAAAMAMRNFDRTQAQKIRKPKGEAEQAEEIAERLEQLADDEDFVYATLAACMAEGQAKGVAQGEPTEDEVKTEPMEEAEGSPGKEARGDREDGQETGSRGSQASADSGMGGSEGRGDPASLRREAAERQERITEELRDLEEKLKRLQAATELAKQRMARAAEEAEEASGALARGDTAEATEAAGAAGGTLHELARHVKGLIAEEAAPGLAMARDLANELAGREEEMAAGPSARPPSPAPDGRGERDRPPATGQGNNEGEEEGKGGGKNGEGQPGPGDGRGGRGDAAAGRTDAEDLERLTEAALTLEDWLKAIEGRDDNDPQTAEKVRQLMEQGTVAEAVRRVERIGEVFGAGRREEARAEAREVAGLLEVLGQTLDVLHRGIVSPRLAALAAAEKQVAELMASLKTLRTDAEITAWHRRADLLIRELEQADLDEAAGVADLVAALRDGGWGALHGGTWHWGVAADEYRIAPGGYATVLDSIVLKLQGRIQDMILTDLVSARDEAAPPEFKELVERYYEVLSKGGAGK